MLHVRNEILIVINEYFVCSILILISEENNCQEILHGIWQIFCQPFIFSVELFEGYVSILPV